MERAAVTRTVVVFGATSFVGGELIGSLLADGRRVVAVTRRPALAELVLDPGPGLEVTTPAETVSVLEGRDFDIVNLAYVKDAPTSTMYEANRRLIQGVEDVAQLGCRRIIHISTAAVFGYRFSSAPSPEPAKWRPLGPYSESKIHAERLVERMARRTGAEAVTVRLGNVLGPGAPTWTAGIAQRILEGKAVSYAGEAGFLNGTHVANIASYLAFLLGVDGDATAERGPIHHLAELSSHRWPELLDVMGEAVGRDWREASRGEGSPGVDARLKGAAKAAYTGRAGSYARAAMDVLPRVGGLERLMDQVKASSAPAGVTRAPVASPDDAELLDVLSSEYEFRTAALAGWSPPVDFAMTCEQTVEWLRDAGYSLRLQG